MNVKTTKIPGVLIIEPQFFEDSRGYFLESFQAERYHEVQISESFVQDNISRSSQNVLRGLHYQTRHMQAKLVYVTKGAVFDVAVDIRKQSKTFGQWTSVILDDQQHRQIYIPPGCAHGFCVLSNSADLSYKCTDYYDPNSEITLRWDDPEINIAWPTQMPILSEKDQQGKYLKEIPLERLPDIKV